MNGYGSHGLKTTSTTLKATHTTTMTVWMMMNRQEPIAPTTVSDIRSPALFGWWMLDRLWLMLINHPFHRATVDFPRFGGQYFRRLIRFPATSSRTLLATAY